MVTERLKQNAEQYRVRESSPVRVQWAVRWVGEDIQHWESRFSGPGENCTGPKLIGPQQWTDYIA